ncbi:MAG: ribose 5-phosphate isomerase B [Ignavibacteria bacterium]|jgi:ribose 5-phosphate isomerase B|nr:ribose 5-phosphate isomerase B [Ignavibacteria bacterium]MCU7503912.1 ribose 5-phosphate isomerase B [Ignavibacteria bacterium]MCU7515867.1 ribose 5-phosphate isomerase B [Ignavibacteria bacterium]
MKIAIASDHAGFRYKEIIKKYLCEKGFEVLDHGTASEESVDYPDFIRPAALEVAMNKVDRAIGVCGSGIGVSIVANKVRGVRAALALNEQMAELSVMHNNANFLALSERFIDENCLLKIVDAWLNAKFEGGRHLRRVNKIEQLEN